MNQQQKWISISILGIFIISLASLGLSYHTFQITQETAKKYDNAIAQVQHHSIIVRLEVTDLNGTEYTLPVFPVGPPDYIYDSENIVRSVTYSFIQNTRNYFNEPPDFRWVCIRVFVPTNTYAVFDRIAATWNIEEHSGILHYNDFSDTGTIGGFVDAQTAIPEVTGSLNQDDIPDEINVVVTLENA